tara:strand:- start:1226 stop:1906 length:681 start_codon:yes stop_codon:yes gene_type:complete
VIRSFSLSIRQLPDPAFRKVLIRALVLAIIVFVGLAGVVWFVLAGTSLFRFWFLEMIVDVLGGVAAAVVTWLLFPAVASLFVSLFLEDIVDAVDIRHYPDDPRARAVALSTTIVVALRFTGITLALNIVVLPFYFLTFWFPPFALVIFYCLNGYLLSREYYELVALRHLDPADAAMIRKNNKRCLFLAGVVVTFFFTIPIVNLFAPVIGVAAMAHIFRSLRIGEAV